jgi:hypothetical protein
LTSLSRMPSRGRLSSRSIKVKASLRHN